MLCEVPGTWWPCFYSEDLSSGEMETLRQLMLEEHGCNPSTDDDPSDTFVFEVSSSASDAVRFITLKRDWQIFCDEPEECPCAEDIRKLQKAADAFVNDILALRPDVVTEQGSSKKDVSSDTTIGVVGATGMSKSTTEDIKQLQAPTSDRVQEPTNDTPFVPTPLQERILKALDGKALKKQKLADEVCNGEGTTLYRPGGIKELRDLGLVNHKPGVGYYRPNKPPPNAMQVN